MTMITTRRFVMWCITRSRAFPVLRHAPPCRSRRPLPRALRTLAEPRIRAAWNRLGDYTPRERREVVDGRWRQASSVQLVSDATDRDRGGFCEPVGFATDEAAAEFVAQESADDEAAAQVPTLQAARLFFLDLARNADAEVDVESMALHPHAPSGASPAASPPVSQAERVAEARDVHRHFFADYYIQQGLVEARDKFDFVDAMLRPSQALFQVNAEKPLQRLVVRHQLEQHYRQRLLSIASSSNGTCVRSKYGGVVFAPTTLHPLIYVVAHMPTQRVGEPDYIPYTAANSILACREAEAVVRTATQIASHGDDRRTHCSALPQPCDAEAAVRARLGDMLCEEVPESGTRWPHAAPVSTASRGKAEGVGHRTGDKCVDATKSSHDHASQASTALADRAGTDEHSALVSSCRQSAPSVSHTAEVVPGGMNVRGNTHPPAPAERCHWSPPSLQDLQWLQRQLASDGLVNIDALSPLICIIAARAALSSREAKEEEAAIATTITTDGSMHNPVILDLCGASSTYRALFAHAAAVAPHAASHADTHPHALPETRCDYTTSYYRDVVHYLATIACDGQPRQTDSHTDRTSHRVCAHSHDAVASVDSSRESSSCASTHAVSLAHRVTVVAALPRTSSSSSSSSSSAHDIPSLNSRFSSAAVAPGERAIALVYACVPKRGAHDVLRGRCAVVLCTPDTSNDGIRPRHCLSADLIHNSSSCDARDEQEMYDETDYADASSSVCTSLLSGEGAGGANGWSTCAADDFVHRCAQVRPARVASLCARLRGALAYADAARRGWVIYATQSLNPMENEAVVCATLTAWQQHAASSPGTARVECVSLLSAAAAIAMGDSERAVLQSYYHSGRQGLTHWCTVSSREDDVGQSRGAHTGQEEDEGAKDVTETGDVRRCCPEIVSRVAAAAWRSQPTRDGRDGCFFIALRLHPTRAPATCQSSVHEARVGCGGGGRSTSVCTDADGDVRGEEGVDTHGTCEAAVSDFRASVSSAPSVSHGYSLWCSTLGECALMQRGTWQWVKQMLPASDIASCGNDDEGSGRSAGSAPLREMTAALHTQRAHSETVTPLTASPSSSTRSSIQLKDTVRRRDGWTVMCAGVPVATVRTGHTRNRHTVALCSAMSNTHAAHTLAQRLRCGGSALCLLPPPGHGMHLSAVACIARAVSLPSQAIADTHNGHIFRVRRVELPQRRSALSDARPTQPQRPRRRGGRVAHVEEMTSADGAGDVRATWCAAPLAVLAALLRRGMTQSCSVRDWLLRAQCDVREADAELTRQRVHLSSGQVKCNGVLSSSAPASCARVGSESAACMTDVAAAAAQEWLHDIEMFCRSLSDAHARLAAAPQAASPSTLSCANRPLCGYLFLRPALPTSQHGARTNSSPRSDSAEQEVVRDDEDSDETESESVLHPAVVDELSAVVVVVRVSCAPPSASAPPTPKRDNKPLSARLFPCGVGDYILSLHTEQDGRSAEGRYDESVTQMAVGLGDALEYVLRKMHRSVPHGGHTAHRKSTTAPAEASPTAVAELAEDEFALVTDAQTAGATTAPTHRREQQRWTRLSRKLQRVSALLGAGGEEAADWVQERRRATEAARARAASPPPHTRKRHAWGKRRRG